MKSAYEIAMERLATEDPKFAVAMLTEAQRQQLSDIDMRYDAKIAEREIFLETQIANAEPKAREAIQQQLNRERDRLNDERESNKERVREAS